MHNRPQTIHTTPSHQYTPHPHLTHPHTSSSSLLHPFAQSHALGHADTLNAYTQPQHSHPTSDTLLHQRTSLSQPLVFPNFTTTPTTTHTHSGTLHQPHTLLDTLQLLRSPTFPALSADDHATDTRRFTVYTNYLPHATSPPLSPPLSPTLHTSPIHARTRYTRPPNTPTTPLQSDHDSDDSFPPYNDAEFQPLPATPSVVQIDPDLDGCNPSAANPLPYTNTDDYHADPLRYLQFQHDTFPPLSQGDLLSPDDYPSDASSDT